MKKRSMLALASLATGFVVAAITPSHGAGADDLGDLNTGDSVSTPDHTAAGAGLDVHRDTSGQSD
ncbi:hypothetical protein ABZY09_34550 [Streptomyces sp. NPDC002928]|uniref:hypothetical protein n=1 Tax=Streptomyces sp. NPDC002928 TaxID=3154440 RepID=UPI0033B7AC84